MEGHKRVAGSPVCPTPAKRVTASVSPGRSLVSPPPTPSPATSLSAPMDLTHRSISQDPSFQDEASFEICNRLKFEHLPGGGYRRRNPNWDSAADLKLMQQQKPHHPQLQPYPITPTRNFRAGSPAASLVPTVLVDNDLDDIDDRISDISSDDDAFGSGSSDTSSGTMDGARMYPDTPLGRQSSFVARISDYARFNKSMVTIFRAKKNEVPRIERETRRRGVYAATMPRTSSGSSRPIPTGDASMLVVLGKSSDFVDEVAARAQHLYSGSSSSESDFGSQQQLMPGTIERKPVVEGPRMVTFFQMFAIATITSVLVVYGISLIPS